MTPELTYVKAYSLHLNGDRYLMAMPYINQGALNINFQIFNYSITNTWNTEFVNTVISEVFQPLVPELAINKDNTEEIYQKVVGAFKVSKTAIKKSSERLLIE